MIKEEDTKEVKKLLEVLNSPLSKLASELVETVVDDVINSPFGNAFNELSVSDRLTFKEKLLASINEHLLTDASKIALFTPTILGDQIESSDYFAKISEVNLYSLENDNPVIEDGRLIANIRTLEYLRHKE